VRRSPSESLEQAVARILAEHPNLYDAYRAEAG
jgi:hypothetical protein